MLLILVGQQVVPTNQLHLQPLVCFQLLQVQKIELSSLFDSLLKLLVAERLSLPFCRLQLRNVWITLMIMDTRLLTSL